MNNTRKTTVACKSQLLTRDPAFLTKFLFVGYFGNLVQDPPREVRLGLRSLLDPLHKLIHPYINKILGIGIACYCRLDCLLDFRLATWTAWRLQRIEVFEQRYCLRCCAESFVQPCRGINECAPPLKDGIHREKHQQMHINSTWQEQLKAIQ